MNNEPDFKMCNRCYEISDTFSCKNCGGKLIEIDAGIIDSISCLNKVLKTNNYPFRTAYSCSGHVLSLSGKYVTGFPYVAFGHFNIDIKEYIRIVFNPLVDELINNMDTIPNIKVISNFEIQNFEAMENDNYDSYSHLLCINGFTYSYQTLNEIEKYEIQNFITFFMNSFLLKVADRFNQKSLEDFNGN